MVHTVAPLASTTVQLEGRTANLAKSLLRGLSRFGVVEHSDQEAFFAYEVDGYGSTYFMDDANVPSLLSLPYLGFLDIAEELCSAIGKEKDSEHAVARDEEDQCAALDWRKIYASTRERILSVHHNPFYFKGSAGEGVGGPHVGFGMVKGLGTEVGEKSPLCRL